MVKEQNNQRLKLAIMIQVPMIQVPVLVQIFPQRHLKTPNPPSNFIHRSYRHLHRNYLVRLVPLDNKILRFPAIDAPSLFARNLHLGEVSWLTLQLRLESLNVVEVDMRIAHDVRQASGDELADVGQHVRQEGVAGDVEGHPETHVARPLVELAMEVALGLVFGVFFFASLSRV